MTENKGWKNGLGRVSRRTFVKGVGAAGIAISGVTALPRWAFGEDTAGMYTSAAIDWKQFSGQSINLGGPHIRGRRRSRHCYPSSPN